MHIEGRDKQSSSLEPPGGAHITHSDTKDLEENTCEYIVTYVVTYNDRIRSQEYKSKMLKI